MLKKPTMASPEIDALEDTADFPLGLPLASLFASRSISRLKSQRPQRLCDPHQSVQYMKIIASLFQCIQTKIGRLCTEMGVKDVMIDDKDANGGRNIKLHHI